MKKTKIVAVLILLALAAGSVSALDLTSFPEPIEKGSLLISPMFGFGFFSVPGVTLDAGKIKDSSEAMLGGTAAFDYALPFDFAPLTVGLESGFYTAKADEDGDSSVNIIPIIARIAWHPNFEVSGLDVYALVKLGWAVGFWGGKYKDDQPKGWSITDPSGLIYGGNIGVRYFFTDRISVFVEGGYEYYILTYQYEIDYAKYYEDSWPSLGALLGKKSYDVFAGGTKYVSAGVTFKLF